MKWKIWVYKIPPHKTISKRLSIKIVTKNVIWYTTEITLVISRKLLPYDYSTSEFFWCSTLQPFLHSFCFLSPLSLFPPFRIFLCFSLSFLSVFPPPNPFCLFPPFSSLVVKESCLLGPDSMRMHTSHNNVHCSPLADTLIRCRKSERDEERETERKKLLGRNDKNSPLATAHQHSL